MKTLRRLTMVLASSGALLLGIGLHTDTAEALCGRFPASGQTTAYTADKLVNLGATVPDDGTVEAGKTLKYKDNGDGTITDQVTGLIWEKKCNTSGVCPLGSLHNVEGTFPWSRLTVETIWDWLDDVNAANFAGHDDWRIPNVKELQSIVDYERSNPSINPIFGPTAASFYWSSTTNAFVTSDAWFVDFNDGDVSANGKTVSNIVRAVRGGCS